MIYKLQTQILFPKFFNSSGCRWAISDTKVPSTARLTAFELRV